MRGPGSVKEALGRELGRFGAVLELSWGRSGAVLGRSWALVGLPWAPLGLSLAPPLSKRAPLSNESSVFEKSRF